MKFCVLKCVLSWGAGWLRWTLDHQSGIIHSDGTKVTVRVGNFSNRWLIEIAACFLLWLGHRLRFRVSYKREIADS